MGKQSSERSNGAFIQTKIRKQTGLASKLVLFLHCHFATTKPLDLTEGTHPVAACAIANPSFQVIATHHPSPEDNSTCRWGEKGQCHRKHPWHHPGPMSTPWPPQNALSLWKMPEKAVVSQPPVLVILQAEYNGKIRWTFRRQYGRMPVFDSSLYCSLAMGSWKTKSYMSLVCFNCLLCKKKNW